MQYKKYADLIIEEFLHIPRKEVPVLLLPLTKLDDSFRYLVDLVMCFQLKKLDN